MRLLGEPGDKTPGRAWGRGSRESLGTRLPGESGDEVLRRAWPSVFGGLDSGLDSGLDCGTGLTESCARHFEASKHY